MNGSELYHYILDNTLHELRGTWEVTQDNELKVTGTNVNGSYVVFPDALTNFILEWDMTVLASAGIVRINSGISPILLTDPTGSSVESWNNGTITNAKFVYFMCNFNGSGDGNVGTLKSISDNGSLSSVNSSTGSFTVGTKYTYKLVRADGYLRLYQDNNLISEYQETTYADTPFYLGWYMWWGGTYTQYQANFIIDNYIVTDLSTNTTKYLNGTGLSEVWTNTKNYIASQLLGKSDVGHTHSASDITSGLATVATSGSYNDLSNKPTIPTVNNATLTIQKNGTTVKTFTANASSNVTANITVPTKTSDLTNDSGFITSDNTKIPLAGSNQISGSLIPATTDSVNLGSSAKEYLNAYIKSLTINGTACGDILTHNASEFVPRSGGGVISGKFLGHTTNDNELLIGGGDERHHGGCIALEGVASPWPGAICVVPQVGDGGERYMWILPNGTWTWNGTACQITSDQRLKQQISEIDDKLLDAWEDVELSQFKYNDAVDEKGSKARLHTGYVVQQIDSACKSHGVDVSQYGLYCHEENPEETEEVEVEQADGTKVKETKVIREASEHYSLRYTEALIVECAYLRKCIKELRTEIEQLKSSK